MTDPHRLPRRRLVQGFASLGLLGAAPGRVTGAVLADLFAPRGGRDEEPPRTLVLLQLTGGNDGLSLVVPHGDDAYHAARGPLAHAPGEVLRLDDYRGLHPALGGLRDLWDRERLALVEGCGYERPNRSHFQSFEIWHTADRRGREAGDGWVGRCCAAAFGEAADPVRTVHVGASVPWSLQSALHRPASFLLPAGYRFAGDVVGEGAPMEGGMGGDRAARPPEDDVLDALRAVREAASASSVALRGAVLGYEPRVEYPDTELALALRHAAGLLRGGIGTRVVSVELRGFDTHRDQRARHDALMVELDGAVSAFLADLEGTPEGARTTLVAYSEFGRRVAANGSGGTDHGTAGPMLVAGPRVRAGLHGAHPSLTELDQGDLVYTTDFRAVLGAVGREVFGVAPDAWMADAPVPLGLFREA